MHAPFSTVVMKTHCLSLSASSSLSPGSYLLAQYCSIAPQVQTQSNVIRKCIDGISSP